MTTVVLLMFGVKTRGELLKASGVSLKPLFELRVCVAVARMFFQHALSTLQLLMRDAQSFPFRLKFRTHRGSCNGNTELWRVLNMKRQQADLREHKNQPVARSPVHAILSDLRPACS